MISINRKLGNLMEHFKIPSLWFSDEDLDDLINAHMEIDHALTAELFIKIRASIDIKGSQEIDSKDFNKLVAVLFTLKSNFIGTDASKVSARILSKMTSLEQEAEAPPCFRESELLQTLTKIANASV